MDYSVVREMTIKHTPVDKEEKINIDISFLKVPCNCKTPVFFVTLKEIDITMHKEEEGNQAMIEPNVTRERINNKGNKIGLVHFFFCFRNTKKLLVYSSLTR